MTDFKGIMAIGLMADTVVTVTQISKLAIFIFYKNQNI